MGTLLQGVLLLALALPAFNAAAAAPMGENSRLAPLEAVWEGGVLPADGPAAILELAGRHGTGKALAGLAALLGAANDARHSFDMAAQHPRRGSLTGSRWTRFFKKIRFDLPAPRPGTTTLTRRRLSEGVYRLFISFAVIFAAALVVARRI